MILRFSPFLILSFFSLVGTALFSQTISPQTFNNGGGSVTGLEWNMGESVSIAYFSGIAYNLNTGVLQPLTNLVTAINENGPDVFGTDIIMGPNPTSNKLIIKAKFNQLGILSMKLIDSKSSIIKIIEESDKYSQNNYEREIDLETFPVGVYYVRILFMPTVGVLKTGIYKIVKI